MDWLSNILTSANGVVILVIVLLFASFLMFLAKKGIISFEGKGLKIGDIQYNERIVLQRQTTFVHAQLDAIANRLNIEHPEYDKYKTRWICKCAELEWIRAIQYNNITDTDGYKDDRLTALLALVQKKVDNEYFFGKEFEQFLRNHVDVVVRKLVQIRKGVE